MNIDRNKVVHAARNGIPLVIKTHTLPSQTEGDLEEILLIYLEELGQAGLKDHLAYCLKELTVNAKKANTKRVYFLEKNLRLDVPAEYERGMKTFKTDTLDNIQHYLELQEQKDLYIKVSYLIRNNVLYMSVRNNVPITPKELTRVFDRVARSRAFESMEEAFGEVLDDSEGAGLGIVIMILMLRKMGLTEKSFDLTQVGNETSASLTIPMNAVKLERVNLIADEIIHVIDSLPPFPENLEHLLRLLGDPDVPFEKLATQLAHDPAMTADLIRYVNSAKYGIRKKIDTLQDAVRIVGIQGIKDMVYPYGAHKILDKYMAKQKHLWQNATRVSFYAAEMAKDFKFSREDQSQAQIAGILYNLGQIILSFLHPDQSHKIMEFCRSKGFSIELFDELTQAINPSDLGARIAEKWNFPDDLVHIIKNQNQPQSAPAPLQPITCVVHLAGSLLSIEQDLLNYNQINGGVLKALRLADPARLTALHDRVRESFHNATQGV
jgi:HD-like signal output (HDOD) protein